MEGFFFQPYLGKALGGLGRVFSCSFLPDPGVRETEVFAFFRKYSTVIVSVFPCVQCAVLSCFCAPQTKERGSTRVHALNNVNKVLQVLHQNNVSSRRFLPSSPAASLVNIWWLLSSQSCGVPGVFKQKFWVSISGPTVCLYMKFFDRFGALIFWQRIWWLCIDFWRFGKCSPPPSVSPSSFCSLFRLFVLFCLWICMISTPAASKPAANWGVLGSCIVFLSATVNFPAEISFSLFFFFKELKLSLCGSAGVLCVLMVRRTVKKTEGSIINIEATAASRITCHSSGQLAKLCCATCLVTCQLLCDAALWGTRLHSCYTIEKQLKSSTIFNIFTSLGRIFQHGQHWPTTAWFSALLGPVGHHFFLTCCSSTFSARCSFEWSPKGINKHLVSRSCSAAYSCALAKRIWVLPGSPLGCV